MKSLSILIAAALLFSSSLFAQNHPNKNVFKPKRLGAAPSPGTSAKSTATLSRLIATATDEHDGSNFVHSDSAFVTYSGERGGDMHNAPKFDNGTMWYNTGGGLEETEKMAQTFDGNDNILSSLYQEWNGTTWENSYGTAFTYDGNYNTLSETEVEWNGTAWDSVYKYLYIYDVNNKLVNEVGMSNNGSVWENEYQYINDLDLNSNVLLSLYMTWNTGANIWDSTGKQHYTYNSNNLQIEWWDESWQVNMWQKHSRYLTTYDLNDHPVTEVRQSWNGSAWIDARIVTNTFTNGDLVNTLEQDGSSTNITNQVNTFDGNHNKLTNIEQTWQNNNFVNYRKTQWTYNNFDQVTSDTTFSWVNNSWGYNGWNWASRYYYETYTAGINDNRQANNTLNIYPVPASNAITVEMVWDEQQPFIVAIIDMHGRQVATYSEKAAPNYKRTIDVGQLSSGNYFIKIAPNGGKASYQQFVIAR